MAEASQAGVLQDTFMIPVALRNEADHTRTVGGLAVSHMRRLDGTYESSMRLPSAGSVRIWIWPWHTCVHRWSRWWKQTWKLCRYLASLRPLKLMTLISLYTYRDQIRCTLESKPLLSQ